MSDVLEADLNLLHFVGGQLSNEMPAGIACFTPPPRKAARGRERDTLYICLQLRGRVTVPPARYTKLLPLAANTFYSNTGSVTSALRTALTALNNALLEENLREGQPVQGTFIGAVLRGKDFYAIHCGPGQIIAAHPNATERFPNLPSRPIGLSNALDAQYFHTAVDLGDYFILTSTPFTDALTGLGGLLTLSAVIERLKQNAPTDGVILVGRFEEEGNGALVPTLVTAPSPLTPPPPTISAAPLEESVSDGGLPTDETSAASTGTDWRGLLKRAEQRYGRDTDKAETPPIAPPASHSEPTPEPVIEQRAPAPMPVVEPEPEPEPIPVPVAPTPIAEPIIPEPIITKAEISNLQSPISDSPSPDSSPSRARRLAREGAAQASEKLRAGGQSFARAFAVTFTESVRGLRRLLARMLPEGTMQRDGLFTVPTSVLTAIAVIIAIVVVGIAVLLYVQQGRVELYDDAMKLAQSSVAQARTAESPLAARPHWEAALAWLARAEELRPTDSAVLALKQESQGALDSLDGVTRIDFRPLVVGGLGRDVVLKQIVVLGRDIYALDTNAKRVWRLSATNTGYAADREFKCTSGTYGQVTLSNFIDLAVLTGPDGEAAVIALDTTGGLIYCAPSTAPLAIYLPSPSGAGWVTPMSMDVYQGSLYVLDPGQNQLWQLTTSQGSFAGSPQGYFTSFAYDIKDALDFAITNDGEVNILRKDGRILRCTRNLENVATCDENVQYTDERQGRSGGPRLSDLKQPRQLLYASQPDYSFYVPDADDNGIYRLTLRLAFYEQYRPTSPLPAPISALAIDFAHGAFYLSAGDNVYEAVLP